MALTERRNLDNKPVGHGLAVRLNKPRPLFGEIALQREVPRGSTLTTPETAELVNAGDQAAPILCKEARHTYFFEVRIDSSAARAARITPGRDSVLTRCCKGSIAAASL